MVNKGTMNLTKINNKAYQYNSS